MKLTVILLGTFSLLLLVNSVITEEMCCGKNEVLNCIGFDCQTCKNYKYVRCAAIREPHCFCKDGYVRRDDNKECTAISDCPVCGKNEEMKDIGFDCQTCKNHQNVRCATMNGPRCFCKDGYVRRDNNGECTAISDCPK